MRGFSLLEVMIALVILTSMSMSLYVATSQMLNSKTQVEARDEAFHAVSMAMNKMSMDMNMAYLVGSPILLGEDFGGPLGFAGEEDRLDFVSFSHLRYFRGSKEDSRAEIGYFLAPMPEDPNKKMLMRREAAQIDKDFQTGGKAFALLENVDSLYFEYLDSKTAEWKKTWNTTSAGVPFKLPSAVKINLKVWLPEEEEATDFSTLATIELNKVPLGF